MFKRVTSLFAALCLSIALILPVSAKGETEVLSPDTIVSNENVNQVLESLGIDPRELRKAEASSNNSVIVTVGELEQALTQLKQLPTEIKIKENSNNLKTNNLASSAFCTGLKMLYYTTNIGGSFELSYEVATNYSWSKFTSVNNATVSVIDNDDNLFTTFTINKREVSADPSFNGDKVKLTAKVVVDSWLSVGSVGLIKVMTTSVDTSKEWNASTELPQCV
ncbi:hypothetical protein [Bacillus sp. FJAT-26390]|uniref:hypothetical protein n=1 Tax=Bacillus sp. FJAT-26390 TaxID=1743142 RepID=UPI00080803B9|nr:hypothetical protein [Bacillus sp. FJAT-26390]OBZ10265.1 hypothetical protein A7975_23230 [Bacillus sp. FJAT-26390]